MSQIKIIILFILFLLPGALNYAQGNNTAKKTLPGNTKPSARAENVQQLFARFFELNEGDSSQLGAKVDLGLTICKTDSLSKFCPYAIAWGAILSKDYESGLDVIEALERKYPEWAEIYYLHGQYLFYKKETGFIELAQKSLEMDPTLIQPCYFLASMYSELQNYKLSLVYYDRLEKLAPKYPSLYYNRAHVKTQLKIYEGAVADYTKALEGNPSHMRALFNRGHAYMLLKDYVNAESDFTVFITQMPRYATAYYYRGAAKYYLEKKAEACEDMQTGARLGNQDAATFITNYCK